MEDMYMDITLNVEDYLLNVRASGIIIHDNKILLHKNINHLLWYFSQ